MNNLIFREHTAELEESEILEYLLKFCKSSADKEETAAALIDHFGSLKNVLEAKPEALQTVQGVGPKSAELIASFLPIVRLYQRLNNTEPHRISNSTDASHFCLSLLEGMRNEEFWVICMNAQCQVIGKRRISVGSLSEVAAYPRAVLETALNYNAHSVIFTHNHPGGTCAPSREDITSTQQLQRILQAINIAVLDHIIVAREQTYSMIQHGDIDYRTR